MIGGSGVRNVSELPSWGGGGERKNEGKARGKGREKTKEAQVMRNRELNNLGGF